jgi:hypothetical protein
MGTIGQVHCEGKSFDIRHEYQQVLHRLGEWEIMFRRLQEQLHLKEKRIVLLEEKIAQLSLEIQEMNDRT